MISAALNIHAWSIGLCRQAMSDHGLADVARRVTVRVTTRTPTPYAYVPQPTEAEDAGRSDRDQYACIVTAGFDLYGKSEAELARIAARMIDTAETFAAADRYYPEPDPIEDWTLLLIQLAGSRSIPDDDETSKIFGRRVEMTLFLTRARE